MAATVEELADKLAVALAELRELARGIHPAVLSDHGLATGDPRARRARRRSPVECDLAFEDRLPAPIEAAAYFVVAEGLTNVIKYANAAKATVSVRRRGGTARGRRSATTASAARGSTPARACAASATGSRRSRASSTLDSPLGEGTRLSARIPPRRGRA